MTATTMLDLRRNDLRSNVLENPYWISSGSLEKEADDKAAVLFSFPATPSIAPGYGTSPVYVHMFAFEVVTAYAGGTVSINIGQGTIATDAAVNDDTVTSIDANMWMDTADITEGTAGHYGPYYGGNWRQDQDRYYWSNSGRIVPADSTVVCVVGYLTSSGTITAGAGRFHFLISVIPSYR